LFFNKIINLQINKQNIYLTGNKQLNNNYKN